MRALDGRFETAVTLATEAGALAVQLRASTVASLKGPQDWVTEADKAVERFISERLAAAFPSDGFQGEEGGITRGGSLRWVVDPIDGTANYMRGSPRFCVSIACMEDRQPLLGVIVAPALGETFTGREGGGALLNGQAIHVSETPSMDRAFIEVGWSHRRPNETFQALCGKLQATGAVLRLNGSGALGLTDVAAGRADGYTELHINLWDVAAGLVILAEADAAISDFLAGDGPTQGNPILACTPNLASALSDITGFPASRP